MWMCTSYVGDSVDIAHHPQMHSIDRSIESTTPRPKPVPCRPSRARSVPPPPSPAAPGSALPFVCAGGCEGWLDGSDYPTTTTTTTTTRPTPTHTPTHHPTKQRTGNDHLGPDPHQLLGDGVPQARAPTRHDDALRWMHGADRGVRGKHQSEQRLEPSQRFSKTPAANPKSSYTPCP